MKKHLKKLSKCRLFHGITPKGIEGLLCYLHPRVIKYRQGDILFQTGDKVTEAGILLKGQLQVLKYHAQGDRMVICVHGEGTLFAENLVLADMEQSPVTLIAEKDTEVMHIRLEDIFPLALSDKNANKFMKNMMFIGSTKISFCIDRFYHLSKKTTRRKLLSYFDELAELAGSKKFVLPFSKTILADYLFLDRSAMMRELSNMKRDGVIDFTGTNFTLK